MNQNTKTTRTQEMIARLQRAAEIAPNGQLLMEAAQVLEVCENLQSSLLQLLHIEGNWRIPLSDGVRAEVTILGNASAAHVRAFAEIFLSIAEKYVAPDVVVAKEELKS